MKNNAVTKYQTFINKGLLQKWTPMLLVAVVFGMVGAYVLISSRAATPVASLEGEMGTVSSPATKISDTTASGGQAVKFGPEPITTPTEKVILNTTFDSIPVSSPISVTDYKNAMGDPNMLAGTSNLVNTSIRSESGRGNYIRQTLPASDGIAANLSKYLGGASGIVTFPRLSSVVEEVSIQYDIRFANNADGTTFEWKGGGKLPGLAGAIDGTSVGTAAACRNVDPALGTNDPLYKVWSARGMWIGPPAYNSVPTPPGNEWIGYMYNYKKTSTCGDNIRTSKGFAVNKWHTVKQYHKLNGFNVDGTPRADGIHRMWLDGVLVKDSTSYIYRYFPELKATHIAWAIFRGGGSSDPVGTWDSRRTGHIDIDNLLVKSPGLN